MSDTVFCRFKEKTLSIQKLLTFTLMIKITRKQTNQKKMGDNFSRQLLKQHIGKLLVQSLLFGNRNEHTLDKPQELIYNEESEKNVTQWGEKMKTEKHLQSCAQISNWTLFRKDSKNCLITENIVELMQLISKHTFEVPLMQFYLINFQLVLSSVFFLSAKLKSQKMFLKKYYFKVDISYQIYINPIYDK